MSNVKLQDGLWKCSGRDGVEHPEQLNLQESCSTCESLKVIEELCTRREGSDGERKVGA